MLPHDTCHEQVSCIIEIMVETVTSEVVRLLEDCCTKLMLSSSNINIRRLGAAKTAKLSREEKAPGGTAGVKTEPRDEEEEDTVREPWYLSKRSPGEEEEVIVKKSKLSDTFTRKTVEFAAFMKVLGEASVEKMDMLLRAARITETQNPEESLELESQSISSPESRDQWDQEDDQVQYREENQEYIEIQLPLSKPPASLYCSVCQTTFYGKYRQYSMDTHRCSRRFKCSACSRVFEAKKEPDPLVKENTESESAAGDEVEKNKETFRCNTCDKRFVGEEDIGDHLRLHWDDHNKDFHGRTLPNPDVNFPESQGLESQTISCPESTESQCHQKKQSEIYGGTLKILVPNPNYPESRGLQRGAEEGSFGPQSQRDQADIHGGSSSTHRKKILACPSCKEKFLGENCLNMHVCVIYQCPFCPMAFKPVLGEETMACSSCGERFLSKDEFYSHLAAHLTDHLKIHRTSSDAIPQKTREISCHVCQKVFSAHTQLNEHQCLTTFRCTVCPAVFKETRVVDAQETADTGAPAPCRACSTCGKRYSHGGHLNKHLLTHLTDHLMTHQVHFKCQLCAEMFFTQEQLNGHLWKHTTSKPFKCQRCGKLFSKQQLFAKHINHHAKGELLEVKEPVQCPVCPKTFKTRMGLSRHEASHSGEKLFFCTKCDQSFFSAPSFEMHKVQHNLQQICDVCGLIFPSLNHLKTHLRVHTGTKPYACGICDQRYRDEWKLKAHLMLHSGQKSFVCKVCDKRFATGISLRKHQIVHTSGKPFACIACNRRFRFKANLKSHMVVHTGMKPHVCGKCSKSFGDASSYHKHVSEKHSNGKEPPNSLKSASSEEGGKEAGDLQVTVPGTETSARIGETSFGLAASNMEATVTETAAREVTLSSSSEGLLS